jgi:hypothetical protein
MTPVDELKCAMARLSSEDRTALLSELSGWTEEDWDAQRNKAPEPTRFVPPTAAAHPPPQEVRPAVSFQPFNA